MPPSLYEEDLLEEGAGGAAAAVPADVAASMRQFIQALTTPESELEQQLLAEVGRWAARYEPAVLDRTPGRCLAGDSINNCRGSTPALNSEGGTNGSGGRRGSDDAPSQSSSGRGSEEGSSAAWRLCSWLNRAGWPAQHCASIRTGTTTSAGSGGGWQFCSGHEFLLLYPAQCHYAAAPAAAAAASAAAQGGGDGAPSPPVPGHRSCGSGDADRSMQDAADAVASSCLGSAASWAGEAAIVIDPEFSTQFALASPTPRYQALVNLLPRVFVGTYDRLQQLVEWACREMQFSFVASGSGLPPWRSLAHVLNKWRLREDDASGGTHSSGASPAAQQRLQLPSPPPLQLSWADQVQNQPPASQQHQPLQLKGAAGSSPTADGAAAFSAEQQQVMRQLLMQQAVQGTASTPPAAASSFSRIDVALAPSPHDAAAPAVSTPRSMLTAELAGVATPREQPTKPSHWQHQPAQQGPAAAILSIMAHGGST